MILRIAVAVVAGLVLAWLLLLGGLWLTSRRFPGAAAAARLLPDLARLLARLARDRTLPTGVRIRLWLLLGYLALPFDLVPDVIPVIGFADDVLLVALVLRSVARRAGVPALERHWPGTEEGLAVVRRLAGLS